METKTIKRKVLRISKNTRLCYLVLFFSEVSKQRAKKEKLRMDYVID